MSRQRIAIVTGTRAEYGLLRTVMDAVDEHDTLDLHIIATGSHLLEPDMTVREIEERHRTVHRVPMQQQGQSGQIEDARSLGRGIIGMADVFAQIKPHCVHVLGDRIEAFAGASAGSIGGFMLAHMHGGDRAEGIADEAMRHAITKLAHLHLPATQESADRIIAMGEHADGVHVVGSPAIDGLDAIPRLCDEKYAALGSPEIVFLMHPIGRVDAEEQADAEVVLQACTDAGRTLALHPNLDAGRGGIMSAIEQSAVASTATHLPRDVFIGLLRRVRMIVGNSSAGLIECAALRVPCINIGPRQAGRERAGNVIDVAHSANAAEAVARVLSATTPPPAEHPYGDGHTGRRVADLIAHATVPPVRLRKRNRY